MTKSNHSCFTKDVIAVIMLYYATSGVITYWQVGLWEMVRHVVVNGAIVLAWLWSASKILSDTPLPESASIRFPTVELSWFLTGLAIVVGLAANGYAGWIPLPRWLYYVAIYGTPLILFMGLRYSTRSLGLIRPPKRGWLAVLVAVLINISAAILFQVLHPGKAETVPTSDLSNQITGPMAVLVLFGGLLFRAALPEELFLRVGLQPRLAQFMPIGWAILSQTFLFSAAHLHQRIILYQESPLLALCHIMAIDNGLISGYLWHRRRSPLIAGTTPFRLYQVRDMNGCRRATPPNNGMNPTCSSLRSSQACYPNRWAT